MKSESNETLITESDWKAMGVGVRRCCPGNGRGMTQGSTEGHSPWNCMRASRLMIEEWWRDQEEDFRKTEVRGDPGVG